MAYHKDKEDKIALSIYLINIFISFILSIDLNRNYYLNFSLLLIIFVIISIFSSSMKNYILGKTFISFSTIKDSDGPIYRFFGFLFSLFLYITTVIFFAHMAISRS